jgi:hypothetical protein
MHGLSANQLQQTLRNGAERNVLNKIEVSGDVSRKMKTLLERLTDCWSGLNRSRDMLAEVLCEIRTELANDRKFSAVLREHNIPRRSAYDLADDWKRLQELKPSEIVRKTAISMNMSLTAKRLWDAVQKYKLDLREAETEEQARAVLQKVKDHQANKGESEEERFKRQYNHIYSRSENFLAGLSMKQKVNELERLVRELLPNAEISITFPFEKMKVVNCGA